MDEKHKKKLKRAKKKQEQQKLQEVQKTLQRQMNMFQRLPGECSACTTPFPKTKEAHMTWRVVVRSKKKLVRLFCPECQQKAKELVENNNEV